MQSPRRAFLGHLGLSLVGLLARMGLGGPRMPRERSALDSVAPMSKRQVQILVEVGGCRGRLPEITDGELRQFTVANGGIAEDFGGHDGMTAEQARASWRDVRFVGFERPLIPPHRKLQ